MIDQTRFPGGCPDENAVAELVQGLLAPETAARIEQHVDGCERCRALMTELGRLLGPQSSSTGGGLGATTLGRYRIKRALGMGAMGVVYLADDPKLGREVALKLMRPDLFLAPGGQELRMRFDREARLLAQLSHPNVITVYDAGEEEQGVYIAMEYVPGKTLAEWIAARRRAGWEVVHAMVQAGRGLEAAHRAGLVHRDVKPDNLLVGDDGRARIGDFGLAFQAGGAESGSWAPQPRGSRLTQTGALVGTPAYMAPEQLTGRGADARSDQYAFCATLFEILLGRPVSAREDWVDSALSAQPHTPVPASSLPRAVQNVLRRGLRDDPDARYPDMSSLLAELELAATPDRWAQPRSAKWIAVAGGVVAAVLVSVLLLIHMLPSDDPPKHRRPDRAARVSPRGVAPPVMRTPMVRAPAVSTRRPAPNRPAPRRGPRPVWHVIKDAAGAYQMHLPGPAKDEVYKVPTPNGTVVFRAKLVNLKGYGCSKQLGCTFIVGWGDYPEKLMTTAIPENMLDGARDGAVRNVGGKLVEELRISLDGWPGRDLIITKAAPPLVPARQLTLRARMYFVKNRFYQLQALSSSADAKAPIIQEVLDTFALWKPPPRKTPMK